MTTGDEPQLGDHNPTDNAPMLSGAHRYCKRCKQYPENDVLHSIVLRNLLLVDVLCDTCYDWFQRYVQAMTQGTLTLGEAVRTENGIQMTATYQYRAPRE